MCIKISKWTYKPENKMIAETTSLEPNAHCPDSPQEPFKSLPRASQGIFCSPKNLKQNYSRNNIPGAKCTLPGFPPGTSQELPKSLTGEIYSSPGRVHFEEYRFLFTRQQQLLPADIFLF